MFRANRATAHDLTRFHAEDYIEFLQRVAPNSADQYEHLFNQFNIGEDWSVLLINYQFYHLFSVLFSMVYSISVRCMRADR